VCLRIQMHLCKYIWNTHTWNLSHHRVCVTHRVSRGTHGNESYHTCEWGMSHLKKRRVIHIQNTHICNFSQRSVFDRRTGWRRRVRCLIIIGHFPQKSPIISGSFAQNDLQLTACYASSPPCTVYDTMYSKCDMHDSHDSFPCATWLIPYECDTKLSITHSFHVTQSHDVFQVWHVWIVWHVWFTHVTPRIHRVTRSFPSRIHSITHLSICALPHHACVFIWLASLQYMSCLITHLCMFSLPHSYMCLASLPNVTCLTHTCIRSWPHSWMWHASLIRVIKLISSNLFPYVCHALLWYMTKTLRWLKSQVCVFHIGFIYEKCDL